MWGHRLCRAPRGFDAAPVGIAASGPGRAAGLWFLNLITLPLSDLPPALYLSLSICSRAQQRKGGKARHGSDFFPRAGAHRFFLRAPLISRVKASAAGALVTTGRLIEQGGRLKCGSPGKPDAQQFSSPGRLGDAF